ncbi:MAG TPA: glycosyltransferase family A protein [Burkholderiaceae bacterium]
MSGLSIVVIGRDAARTLRACLTALRDFVEARRLHPTTELLYVDSASGDGSREIARDTLAGAPFAWRVLLVDSPSHSAALGRRIGMQEARHQDLLFVDSDMLVVPDWLASALAGREHRVLTGQRCEAVLEGDGHRIVRREFYGERDLGAGVRLGGLFLLRDARRTPARFTPWLRTEEEADFLAQDAALAADVYRTRETAFIHLNTHGTGAGARLRAELGRLPATSSYVGARIAAIRRGDYHRLLRTSAFYEAGALCSLLLLGGLATGQPPALATAGLLVAASRRRAAVAYRSLVFPFELASGLWHALVNRSRYRVRHVLVSTGEAA